MITFECRASKIDRLGSVKVLLFIPVINNEDDIPEFCEWVHTFFLWICNCKCIHWINYNKKINIYWFSKFHVNYFYVLKPISKLTNKFIKNDNLKQFDYMCDLIFFSLFFLSNWLIYFNIIIF